MYNIQFKFTLGQQVKILPFDREGTIVELSVIHRGVVYQVRYLGETSVLYDYFHGNELMEA